MFKRLKSGISKTEIKYILYSGIFAFLMFVVILPNILSLVTNINPFFQFLIFNVGLFFVLTIFLKSVVSDSKIKWGYGIGLVILYIALDIMTPPFLVNLDGTFNVTATLASSASDYVSALGWNAIGISGFLLYIFTYLLTPLILLFIAGLLLKNMVREL